MGHYDEQREAEYADQDAKRKYVPPGLEYWNVVSRKWLKWPHAMWGNEFFQTMSANGTKFRIMGKEGRTLQPSLTKCAGV